MLYDIILYNMYVKIYVKICVNLYVKIDLNIYVYANTFSFILILI